MKRLVYILAFALIGVACNKDIVPVETSEDNIPEGKVKLVITVPVDVDSKADVDGKAITFNTDDKISVIGKLNNVTSRIDLEVDEVTVVDKKKVITFSTTIEKGTEIGEYAYYPASIVNKDAPTTINWPTSFDGTKNQMPLMAKINVDSNEAVFHHLGALLKVTLASAPAGVNALEFKTSSDFIGTYDVEFDDYDLDSITENTLSGKTETITASSTGTYYIPVPADSYADFQLAMKQDDYYYKQKTASLDDPITPDVGNMVNLGTFTYDVDEIEEWYMICKLQKEAWTLSDKSIRFIKTADNEYRATTNNGNDSGDYGYKIQYGSPASYYWSKATGAKYANQYTGDLIENGQNCYYGVSNEIYSATINTSTWKYVNAYVNSAAAYVFTTIDMVGEFNEWSTETGYIRFDKGGAHNWSKLITVSSNSKVEFKIIADSQWKYGNWGGVSVTDSTPYGTGVYRNSESDPDTARDSYTLTPGKYMVYFNDAKGDIMFVKQPKS